MRHGRAKARPAPAAVRRAARDIPCHLLELRGLMMMDGPVRRLGVSEAACPACGATGYLDRETLEVCPICCGFREVPKGLADWLRAQVVCGPGKTRAYGPHGGRYGRAGIPVHLSLPDGSEVAAGRDDGA